MDIKYIYIHGLRTNAYLLAIIDVATRCVLGWSLRLSMKYQDVILCLHQSLSDHKSKKIMLRTDNGSQFISHGLDKYCKTSDITHEFTHPHRKKTLMWKVCFPVWKRKWFSHMNLTACIMHVKCLNDILCITTPNEGDMHWEDVHQWNTGIHFFL